MDAKLKSAPPAERPEAATAFYEDVARSAHATWLGVFLRLFALIRDGSPSRRGKRPYAAATRRGRRSVRGGKEARAPPTV